MPAVVEALIPDTEIPVQPGKEAVARFRVRNTGPDVNNFTFHILGEPGNWTGIRVVGDADGEKPKPMMDLLPNDTGEVELTFRPPQRWQTTAGLVPYGLLVCSNVLQGNKAEEDVETLEEGLLNVAAFHAPHAKLIPRTSRGRFGGKHQLAVDNYGNTTAIATFAAEDAENFLDVRFSPQPVAIQPGTTALVKVKVKPRRKFLLGPPRAAPFKVHVAFAPDGPADHSAPPQPPFPPVDGLHMQRSVIPAVLLPIGVLVAAGVILWAVFKPQADATAVKLAPVQAAAQNTALTRQANALAKQAITTAHRDAVAARMQAASAAKAALKNAQATQKAATTAARAAGNARTAADTAAGKAGRALELATPAFAGTPYGQQLALPARCTPGCSSAQPFTAQPFPAQTYYVTDVVTGNTGGGRGTMTLTLGGAPLLVEPLGPVAGADLKPSTPFLVRGDQGLGVRVSCTQGACSPSVFVSGFFPAKAPSAGGPNGTPHWARLACHSTPACAVMAVPANARSFALTDVIFQNPAGDRGTVTLSRGKQALLVEGLDPSSPGDLPISLAAPIVLKAGESLALSVACRNPGAKRCTPGATLGGVLRLVP